MKQVSDVSNPSSPRRISVCFWKACEILWRASFGTIPATQELQSMSDQPKRDESVRDYSSSPLCTLFLSILLTIFTVVIPTRCNCEQYCLDLDFLSSAVTFLVSSSLVTLPILITFIKSHPQIQESNEIIGSYSLHVLIEFILFGLYCFFRFILGSLCINISLSITLFFALIANIKMVVQIALYSISKFN